MVTKFRLLGLSVALSLLIIPGFALAHVDNEDDLEMSCSRDFGDLTDPEETRVAWWWCYGNEEFEELTSERDPKFSLSMKVVVTEEETDATVKCSGELSTKDFGFVEDLPCDSESTCNLEEGGGHDCHIEEGNFEEAGLDINDVIPGLGECEIAQEEFGEPNVVFKGDIKALHNAAGGDDNGRRDKGRRGSHDKDIEVCGDFM